MKFCKDCKSFKEDDPIHHSKCLNPKGVAIDPITGKKEPYVEFCQVHRGRDGETIKDLICGKEGRWFEPKEGGE